MGIQQLFTDQFKDPDAQEAKARRRFIARMERKLEFKQTLQTLPGHQHRTA